MGKKSSKHTSKKGKSKKNRAKISESNISKEQSKQKSSFEEISEIFLGSTVEQEAKANINANPTENISEANQAKATETTPEANATDNTNECCEEIKAKQQEVLNSLKNMTEAIAAVTLTRDNIDSLRIELLSSIYFTRQVRPLIDAVNLIAFASSNMSSVAQNITINTFGDKKEIKNAFKLCYKMNGEIDDLLDTLTRRIKLYVAQLDNMDRNCPPFDFDKDS